MVGVYLSALVHIIPRIVAILFKVKRRILELHRVFIDFFKRWVGVRVVVVVWAKGISKQ